MQNERADALSTELAGSDAEDERSNSDDENRSEQDERANGDVAQDAGDQNQPEVRLRAFFPF